MQKDYDLESNCFRETCMHTRTRFRIRLRSRLSPFVL